MPSFSHSEVILVRHTVCALLVLILVAPVSSGTNQAERARQTWNPFFTQFLAAIRKRDRKALRQMMVSDIFCSGGVGDDNHDGDMRDDAFKFWDETRAWKALESALRKGATPMALWWNNGEPHKYPSRVAPPIANRKGNTNYRFYAIFEFREDGRWYCVVFNQCCD